MEQTVEAGTVASVIVNVIDDAGAHVAATIDDTTTRLQKGDTSDTTWNNVVPTIDNIATGVYRINFTGLSPAISISDNDDLIRVKINGNIDGESAWTEYHMPLKVISSFDSATDLVSADVTQVSGDATAAGNLSSMYNGTGYIDPSGPAYQAQVKDIAITGTAINTTYDTWNITTGSVVSGTPGDTVARDGVYYQIEPAGGVIDMEITFQIGSDGVPTLNNFFGRLQGNNDEIEVQAYNFVDLAFQKLSSIEGAGGNADTSTVTPLFTNNVGTGNDAGLVRIRLYGTGLGNNDIYIDQLFTSYSVVNRSVGYADGAIWVDGSSGNTGVVPFIDGVADNPVGSYADALSLHSQLNLTRFNFASGTQMTLTQDHGMDVFTGGDFFVNANNQVMPTLVERGILGGEEGGSSANYYRECLIGYEFAGAALPFTATSGSIFKDCGIVLLQIKDDDSHEINLIGCHASLVNNPEPAATIDFGAVSKSHTIDLAAWDGRLIVKNMTAGDSLSVNGMGLVLFDVSCTGGDAVITGDIIHNNLGSVTLTTDASPTYQQIPSWTWDEPQAGHTTVGTFGYNLDSRVSETATPADVNAQVLDVFTVDTFAEPLAVPSATASLVDMIHWNFTVARNKLTQTATTTTLRNDADSATIASAQVSDDGTTFTRGEYL